MEVLREINANKNTTLALGFFDGIHLGHRRVIKTLITQAKLKNQKSAIISFDKNPADYFNEDKTLAIQSFKDKEIILNSTGIDYFYELNFENYKEMSAFEYLKDVLIANFNPAAIIVGYNHTFGKNKEGTAEFLAKFAQEFNYECIVVPQVTIENTPISSSIVRQSIQEGNLDYTRAMLGRYFSIKNSVIKGNKIARTFGYPTANLIWANSIVKLPYGVYYGFAKVDELIKPALISWGKKPTLTQGEEEILEAHIFGLDKDIYGKIISILFDKRIRDEIHFAGMKPLVEQINKDYASFKPWAMYVSKTLCNNID